MMAGNPNWWNMHPPTTSLYHVLAANGSSSVIPALNSLSDHHHLQDPPQSWSQLLLTGNSGLSGDHQEERFGQNNFQAKKLENGEDQMIISGTTSTVNPPPRLPFHVADHVKQEALISPKISDFYGQGGDHEEMLVQANNNINRSANWSQVMTAVSSSPRSCITSLGTTTSSNMLDFSYNNKADNNIARNQTTDQSAASSECNSTATGGTVSKKARVQSSSSQPPLKVRKEKLGDRITALHQLVSPFGKTDTASVLLEAIGYIRFLQSQIEALSSPYLGHASKNMRNQPPYEMEGQGKIKDLRSRGLCVVPVSCTQHVGSDNGADYWAPANYGSGF